LLAGLIIESGASYYRNTEPHLREGYLSVHAAFQAINQTFTADSYRTWEHPGNRESFALTSSKFWGYRLFTQKPFPQFDPADLGALVDRTLIITAPPGEGDETMAQAKRVLENMVDFTREQITKVHGEAGTGFDLVALTVTDKLRQPLPASCDIPEE
jgi:hypothetical protein